MHVNRKSNIEILRIISIILIVLFHCVFHSGLSFGFNFSFNKFMSKIFWMYGELGVNLFVLIMGYFMINAKFKFKKFVKIIFQVLFYHFLTIIFACYIGIYQLSEIRQFFFIAFPVTLNSYWFITAYILIYIFSPYLNLFVKKIEKLQYQKFLLLLLIIFSIIPTFFGVLYNNTESLLYYNRFIWFIVLYLIGAYIKLYSISFIETKKKSIIISVLSFLTLIVSILIIDKFDFLFAKIGLTEVAYLWTPNNIPMLLLSISIFGIFLNMKIKDNKIVNKFASTTLGIYLLHDGVLSVWLWKTVFKIATFQDSILLIPRVLFSSLIVILIGVIVDLIRQLLEIYVLENIFKLINFDKFLIKIDKFFEVDV